MLKKRMGNYLQNQYSKFSILAKYAITTPVASPYVSVIVPVCDVEKHLDDCLLSLVRQTLREIEIICINDGSTDSSGEILQEYAERDSRFVIINQENQGTGCARNNAIKIARGKYLAFVDPDDWILPNTLETLYNFASKKQAQIVQFNHKDYYDSSKEIKEQNFAKKIKKSYGYNLVKTPYFNWRTLKKKCLTKLETHVWVYFYDTKFIKDNNIVFAPGKIGEDHLFAIGAYLLADKIHYMNESLYSYRCREGSAVNSKNEAVFCIFDNIERLKTFIVEHNLWNELSEEFKHYQIQTLIWQYRNVPIDRLEDYKKNCSAMLTSKEYKKTIKAFKTERKFIENIFSIKNKREDGIKYKFITILWLNFTISSKNKNNKEKSL